MNAIEEKCLKKGVRLTDQRKTIAKVISESKEVYGSKDHPDVDELHKRVTSIDNKISKEVMSIDIDKLKVFLHSKNLYPKTKLNFTKFEIQENNFILKEKEYNILRNYFHLSESKPIHVKKSKIFVMDGQDETLIISPIENVIFTLENYIVL